MHTVNFTTAAQGAGVRTHSVSAHVDWVLVIAGD